MKTFRILMLSSALVAALSVIIHAQSGNDLFQKALVKERTEGDIAGAIKIYQAIVQKYGSDRKLAAKALVQVAECYLKLGDEQSRKIFDRIIREYSDQKDAVAIASAHLSAAPTPAGMGSREIWSGPKVDTYGSVSPDGRYLSYVDWENDSRLSLRDLGTGSGRFLNQGGSHDDEANESVISKDGRVVAYASWSNKNQRYGVRLANIEGNANPRPLYDNPDINWIAPYDWSPDGKLIVVALKRKDRTFQIGLISVAEGSLRILRTTDWRGTGRIFFSPDGRYLGYDLPISDTSRERDVFVMSVDGARETAVIVHPSLNFMMGWSPDGKRLLFASDRATLMDLWALPFADGKAQGTPEVIQQGIGWSEPMGVTRTGALYYGVDHVTGSNIQIASLDSETGRIVSPKNIGQEQFEENSQPSWSPDGKFLAYLSERDRLSNVNFIRNTALVIRSAETGRIMRETVLRFFGDSSPRIANWSSDGDAILIRGTDSKGRQGLFSVNRNTGAVTPVDGVTAANNVISPDRKSLYFRKALAEEGGAAFVQRDLDSGRERELYRGKFFGPQWNLSPDGRYIATFAADSALRADAASFTVVLIPTREEKPTEVLRVARSNGEERLPGQKPAIIGWFPDSKSFLFREPASAIWRVPIDGTSPKKLLGDVDFSSVTDVAINSYTQQIAYTLSERNAAGKKAVWMLDTMAAATRSNK